MFGRYITLWATYKRWQCTRRPVIGNNTGNGDDTYLACLLAVHDCISFLGFCGVSQCVPDLPERCKNWDYVLLLPFSDPLVSNSFGEVVRKSDWLGFCFIFFPHGLWFLHPIGTRSESSSVDPPPLPQPTCSCIISTWGQKTKRDGYVFSTWCAPKACLLDGFANPP